MGILYWWDRNLCLCKGCNCYISKSPRLLIISQ